MHAQKTNLPAPLAPIFVTENRSSRIDQLYANAGAQAAFQELAMGEEGECGFPGHLPVFATFCWAQPLPAG